MQNTISYIIPTRDRPGDLAMTLSALGKLKHAENTRAEVIVVDNASRQPPTPPEKLRNGLPVRLILRRANEAAASRNAAARAATGAWLIMLDDDSAPLDTGFMRVLEDAPMDVAAIGAEILLTDGAREAGGLPEVPVGCGVAIRREVFLDLGGYDPEFHFYAEEYDLAARILLAGFRVTHDRRFRVLHRKVADGRDMNAILHRLVRNNGWVEQRYAPEAVREAAIAHTVERYRVIAAKERALEGYEAGLAEMRRTLDRQPRREMTQALYDRFTGLAHARDCLARSLAHTSARSAALVAHGKHAGLVERVLAEQCVSIVASPVAADALVIGTLSPGPMLDARDERAVDRSEGAWRDATGRAVLTAWSLAGEEADSTELVGSARRESAR
jgi:GT2 family glycosyltransferase